MCGLLLPFLLVTIHYCWLSNLIACLPVMNNTTYVYGVLQILASPIICASCTKYVFCNRTSRGQHTCTLCTCGAVFMYMYLHVLGYVWWNVLVQQFNTGIDRLDWAGSLCQEMVYLVLANGTMNWAVSISNWDAVYRALSISSSTMY